MNLFKTHCQYGYSIIGERPPKIDNNVNYIIVKESDYFPYCVIIKRQDSLSYQGEKLWIVPKNSLY